MPTRMTASCPSKSFFHIWSWQRVSYCCLNWMEFLYPALRHLTLDKVFPSSRLKARQPPCESGRATPPGGCQASALGRLPGDLPVQRSGWGRLNGCQHIWLITYNCLIPGGKRQTHPRALGVPFSVGCHPDMLKKLWQETSQESSPPFLPFAPTPTIFLEPPGSFLSKRRTWMGSRHHQQCAVKAPPLLRPHLTEILVKM